MHIQENPRSFIALYWKIWIGVVIFFLVVRFTTLFENDMSFILFSFYFVPMAVGIMIINLIEGRRLMGYLEKHHKEKWKELTYFPGLGPGNVNSFRSLPFLYSKEDLEDPLVKELKLNYRKVIKFMLTVFLTTPILFLIIMLQ